MIIQPMHVICKPLRITICHYLNEDKINGKERRRLKNLKDLFVT
jgi:hypothetical protein